MSSARPVAVDVPVVRRRALTIVCGIAALALGMGVAATGTMVAAATPDATHGASGPLRATPPLNVDGEITDPGEVLGARTPEVQDALDALADTTDLQMFVVYVDAFDGQDGIDWANETANLSGLGPDDLLLAVATEERRYGLSYDNTVALSDADLNQITTVTEDHLRENDWAGAAIAAADATREAATGSGSSSGAALGVLAAGVGVAGAVGAVVIVRRSRRRASGTGGSSPDELTTLSTEELDRRASAALVAIDDAVRTSEQELGFAQAQFGIDATSRFATVLDAAKQAVAEAFALRRHLDDDQPDAAPQARTMMARIITMCDEVTRSLDAESAMFDELRDLQSRAPEVLDETQRRAADVEARLAPARVVLESLSAAYPATALASVARNPDQAAALLANVRDTVDRGRAALASNDRATAVALARAAQNAVGQAVTLVDAVDRAGTDLTEAGTRLDRGIASITADVTDAGRLADNDASLSGPLAEARAAVDEARTSRDPAAGGDPLAALRRLTEAEAALDAALGPFRARAEQSARAGALLRETLGRVDSQIGATNDFVQTRRNAVGTEARTRLSEATRLVGEARALGATDPVAALDRAQEAEAQVQTASQLAQRDVSTWTARTADSDNGVGGMVLGGILLDQILGGGQSGGSRGRRSSGGFGGGFGGGGFGGGSRGRSGGGSHRSSSGGRSGRGGRF